MNCPECRTGTLEIVTDGMVGRVYHPGYHVAGTPLPVRMDLAPFAACNACEFCIEIGRGDLVAAFEKVRL